MSVMLVIEQADEETAKQNSSWAILHEAVGSGVA